MTPPNMKLILLFFFSLFLFTIIRSYFLYNEPYFFGFSFLVLFFCRRRRIAEYKWRHSPPLPLLSPTILLFLAHYFSENFYERGGGCLSFFLFYSCGSLKFWAGIQTMRAAQNNSPLICRFRKKKREKKNVKKKNISSSALTEI